ncbi:Txe/YoeB family addiction module toxin [Subsaximicrobium wynnwilliamsii]|uniref:Putative mRNA interferase YoeB n=1 Tax=Subsaximicrobium wynnwilliamsii TaxID=291179 RepID=A0A5C6ZF52_9FLAO|nr:Txe/YoeB family addiction module toxin [Subsaximicrobium wynnwilliamsii]TXD82192.1 Txe/YoeB family addiction module toxin [Subsaximicrobium wynnwilliamsii]TXD87832.1 Txe/YoeB family addiction module toxin [Subsaximicrobium wynnwilliamsii]TXE01782.1 Txe/YoeB family addiction module toxin [Subsaximicrobium wynnwilliamsii]
MNADVTPNGWEDFYFWLDIDPPTALKIRELIKSIKQNPFKGIGKPEPLKHRLKGFWSRRITGEHRLVHRVSGTKGADQKCSIIQCRFHYDN